MSTWHPTNSPVAPEGTNPDAYNAEQLGKYQTIFRQYWNLLHKNYLESGPEYYLVRSHLLRDLLCWLLEPALHPVSNDIRLSYRLYLPKSVWSDLLREPGTSFEKLVIHFERIMDFYLDETAKNEISWTCVFSFIVSLGYLDADDWWEFVAMWEADSEALEICSRAEYVSKFEAASSLIKERVIVLGTETITEADLDVGDAPWVIINEQGLILDVLLESATESDEDPEDSEILENPLTMPHEQAINNVDGLSRVEIAGHPAAKDKCSFCWGLYDGSDADPEDTNDLTVCKTPCNHMFHRGCLVQILESSSTLCSICFRELNV